MYKPNPMLKDFFYHNSTERKATILLILLVIVLVLVSWSIPYIAPTTKYDFSQFKKEADAFAEGLYEAEKVEEDAYSDFEYKPKRYAKKEKNSENQNQINPFLFDPNNADKNTLLKLGLSEKTVKSILNYREKGGVFKVRSDFSKVFTLKAEEFEALHDFIQLPDSLDKKSYSEKKTQQRKKTEIPTVNVNTATAEDFDKLPGIGPSFAERMVKYRDALGGFEDLAQLEEIYGLSDSIIVAISPYLSISSSGIKKININKAVAEELKTHPYLRWRHANAIVKYREKNGPYKSLEMLRTLHEFNDSEGTFWKIKPYLSL
jgi:competence ComEA-like helix-hairpin-helix protein